jgi:hypothetical protein|tara:strand:+ start:928 stop:1050 length:123 start_codon:yes stop_codon:yes gene_type:complete
MYTNKYAFIYRKEKIIAWLVARIKPLVGIFKGLNPRGDNI